MDKDRVDLILRAMSGDRTAWESLRTVEDSLVPLKNLDESARSRVQEFFAKANATGDMNSALNGIDPEWIKEHPAQMEKLGKLTRTFEEREGNHGEGKI